jgi:hypothetical protein
MSEAGNNLTYTLGVDLGQAQDYTAVSIIANEPGSELFTIAALKRLPLNKSYFEYAEIVKQRIAVLQTITGRPDQIRLAVDRTGVGKAVFDIMVNTGLRPVGITITGGNQVNEEVDGTGFRVPKRDLVGCVKVKLQNNNLKISSQIEDARLLQGEMQNFTYRITDSANDVYGREGKHDDLLLSVACGLWLASRPAAFVSVSDSHGGYLSGGDGGEGVTALMEKLRGMKRG